MCRQHSLLASGRRGITERVGSEKGRVLQTFVEEGSINVLYLHTHDSGRYLDPANAPIPLPRMEEFASQAVRFRNAFSAAPTCSPSRSALLTGLSPHTNGMVGLAHRGFRLNDYSRHLVRLFRNAGYRTALCGVQHVAPRKEEIGYGEILDEPTDYFATAPFRPEEWDLLNAERAASYIKQAKEPFFLSYGLLTTHRPFPSAPDEGERLPLPPAPLPDTPDTRRDTARFCEALRVVDRCFGRIFDAVRTADLWERTVILVTTDHGPPFPRMKGTLRDGGIGISLMLRIPGVAEAGETRDALVSQIDLYPTLLELAGIVPPKSEGRSLLPLLHGEAEHHREAIFAETNYHAVYEPARAVRTSRYKLVYRYGDRNSAAPANVDDSRTKELYRNAGYFRRLLPREELFDLLLDPLEERNLLGRKDWVEEETELRILLDQWMKSTDDPLLSGPTPRPEGTRLNRPDAYSAEEPTQE